MKALALAAFALSGNAYAAVCTTAIVSKSGETIRTFSESHPNYNAACNQAMNQCVYKLHQLQQNGDNPNARCVYRGGNSGPVYPGPVYPGPVYPGPVHPYPPVGGVNVVRCESYNYNYNTCYIGNYVRNVSLRQVFSNQPCIYGQTYGFTHNYIWVNQGCSAEFNVYR